MPDPLTCHVSKIKTQHENGEGGWGVEQLPTRALVNAVGEEGRNAGMLFLLINQILPDDAHRHSSLSQILLSACVDHSIFSEVLVDAANI